MIELYFILDSLLNEFKFSLIKILETVFNKQTNIIKITINKYHGEI